MSSLKTQSVEFRYLASDLVLWISSKIEDCSNYLPKIKRGPPVRHNVYIDYILKKP